MSLPSIETFPDVGESSAPIILSSVLFPEPDGPMTETNSPFETEKVTSFSAYTFVSPLPYVLHKFFVVNISNGHTSPFI
jgi:hypothetical protein